MRVLYDRVLQEMSYTAFVILAFHDAPVQSLVSIALILALLTCKLIADAEIAYGGCAGHPGTFISGAG